jgi:hypothetical protein
MPKQAVKQIKSVKSKSAKTAQPQNSAERREMIAREAYLFAEKRGFQGGDTVADWLIAEAKIDGALKKGTRTQ